VDARRHGTDLDHIAIFSDSIVPAMATPYRKAGGKRRDTERCLFCGVRIDARVDCPSCGREAPPADAERAEALSVSCPRCFIGLELEKPTGDEGAFLYCIGCHGCFVPPVDWGLILESAARSSGAKEDEEATPHVAGDELKALPPEQGLARGALASEIDCPVCRLQMERIKYADREEVDVCGRHGIWFDAAELASVLRESVRPPPDTEKTAAAPASAKEDKRQEQRSAIGRFARMILG
jgi:Zn-finger nucleic acid-binding protein